MERDGGGDTGFRALSAWQKAQSYAAEAVMLVRDLPGDRASETMGLQLLRAAGSVSANIAEGFGRFSPGAYRNHLSIARGSLFEAESWIDLLCRTGFVSPDKAQPILNECHEVGRLLTSMMRSLPTNNAVREEGPDYVY
jgi:four helix bundle protein